jgi:hypothetical protein
MGWLLEKTNIDGRLRMRKSRASLFKTVLADSGAKKTKFYIFNITWEKTTVNKRRK